MGDRPNLCYKWRGHENPRSSGWRLSKEELEEEYQKGNVVIKGNRIERRAYEKNYKGVPLGNLWTEKHLYMQEGEYTGYKTQKPLALLKRIIQASSDKNDIVFDPFCGCATTLVASEILNRNWIGVDISEKATTLVVDRIKKKQGFSPDVIHRADVPKRTDKGDELTAKEKKEHKNSLYGMQEGYCNGCQEHFHINNLTMDHIVSQARGGTDHSDNFQLLCGSCNSKKGKKSQEQFKAELAKEKGINLSIWK